ncbi:MAG: 2-hydroxyacyl-CoA dehydratase subunit D [Filifactoraceae bacterium]
MAMYEIIKSLENVANNPKRVLEDYIEKKGKKVIGCFPVYTPEELIYAGDMLPFGIWGAKVEIDLAKQFFPAFACSIMQSCMELGLKGTYNKLSGVVVPGMCDTLICMGQNWKVGIKDVPFITFVHPQNRKIEAGVEYLIGEYESVKKKLEEISGSKISEEKIHEAIDLYNLHRKAMREFVELVATHLNSIDSKMRSAVIKSGFFMDKAEHLILVEEINKELRSMPEERYKGKSVLVTGIIMDSPEILDILEENNIRVAYDNVAHETRQFMTDVPKGDSALERLARQWSNIEGCSLAYDPKKYRGKMIVEQAKEKGIDGIIYAMMKFCDPEEYDYPIIKKDIDEAGIPNIYIEIDQQTANNEQVRTRIQTFGEILG